MPSQSLLRWQNDRMPRLQHLENQCAAGLAATAPNPHLIEENLRGWVVLLSAHFQGYCRDLYTEAAIVIAARVRPRLRLLIQDQFTAHRKLDHGNPTLQHLKGDFSRIGFTLDLAADPTNGPRLADLALLGKWRNLAAHQGNSTSTSVPLTLPTLARWRASCDGLATSLDGIMYNQLRTLLRRTPW